MSYTRWVVRQSILKHSLFNMVNYCEMQTVFGSRVRKSLLQVAVSLAAAYFNQQYFSPCFVFSDISVHSNSQNV